MFLSPVQTSDSSFTAIPETTEFNVLRASEFRLLAYFQLDPRSMLEGKTYYLDINYIDAGCGKFYVEYFSDDSSSGKQLTLYRSDPIKLTNSNANKNIRIGIENGIWGRQFNGADIRLNIIDDSIENFTFESIGIYPKSTSHTASPKKNDQAQSDSSLLPISYIPNTESNILFPTVCQPIVSIIIPVFNRYAYTRDCLAAISAFTSGTYEVILIDNGSTETEIKELANIANLKYIYLDENIGFAKACNIAAKSAGSEHLLFLNNDTIVQPGWMETMLSCIKTTPNIGIVGSKLLYPISNKVQHAGIEINQKYLPVHSFKNYPYDHPSVNRSRICDAVTGACMLTPTDLYTRLGGFDEQYLNGFEDIDYCFKVRDESMRIVYLHTSVVYHYESISEGRLNLSRDKENLKTFNKRWIDQLLTLNLSSPAIGPELLPVKFDMESPLLQSSTGMVMNNRLICEPDKHGPGHCLYGPYIKINGEFQANVTFNLSVHNPKQGYSPLFSVDVHDSIADKTLCNRQVSYSDLKTFNGKVKLSFLANPYQTLEFRIFWIPNCILTVTSIELDKEQNK